MSKTDVAEIKYDSDCGAPNEYTQVKSNLMDDLPRGYQSDSSTSSSVNERREIESLKRKRKIADRADRKRSQLSDYIGKAKLVEKTFNT